MSYAYPRVLRDEVLAHAIASIERFVPAGAEPLVPFADATDIPVAFRFPSPHGMLRALDGDFVLTPPGVESAFLGDLDEGFAWGGVAEFGTVALLDPVALSPYRVRVRPGWLVCDGAQLVPRDASVFVRDRAMATRLAAGMSRVDAIDAIGRPEWEETMGEHRARAEEYVAMLPALDAKCRELTVLARARPDGVRARLGAIGLGLDVLDGPLFVLSAAQRRALSEL